MSTVVGLSSAGFQENYCSCRKNGRQYAHEWIIEQRELRAKDNFIILYAQQFDGGDDWVGYVTSTAQNSTANNTPE
jgi:hypothetical protein